MKRDLAFLSGSSYFSFPTYSPSTILTWIHWRGMLILHLTHGWRLSFSISSNWFSKHIVYQGPNSLYTFEFAFGRPGGDPGSAHTSQDRLSAPFDLRESRLPSKAESLSFSLIWSSTAFVLRSIAYTHRFPRNSNPLRLNVFLSIFRQQTQQHASASSAMNHSPRYSLL